MNNTENAQAMKRISDMSRLIAMFLLVLHFYHVGYGWFRELGLYWLLTDRILVSISDTGLLSSFNTCKYFSLFFLLVSIAGNRGKKEIRFQLWQAMRWLLAGIILFFFSGQLISGPVITPGWLLGYYGFCLVGVLLIIKGMTVLSRTLWI